MRRRAARDVSSFVTPRSRLLGRRRLLRAALLGAPSLALVGCGPGLTRLEPPSAGVTLRYRFAPGERLRAEVLYRHRTELNLANLGVIRIVELIRAEFECTVVAAVDGSAQLVARAQRVQLDWGKLAVGSPLRRVIPQVTEDLTGTEVDITVDARGVLLRFPDEPSDMPEALEKGLSQLLSALRLAFFDVPGPALPPRAPLVTVDDRQNTQRAVRLVVGTTDARGRALTREWEFDKRSRLRSEARLRGYVVEEGVGPLVTLEERRVQHDELVDTRSRERSTITRLEAVDRVRFSLGQELLRSRATDIRLEMFGLLTHAGKLRVDWSRG